MTTVEHWKHVPKTDGRYSVSSHGRVRSEHSVTPTVDGRWNTKRERILVLNPDDNGRLSVYIKFAGATKWTNCKVSSLVAESFIGARPEGLVVCHNNGVVVDNRVENLRYDTSSGNNFDTVRHGTHHNAKKTHCKWGHEFTPENTYANTSGRGCRTCRVEYTRSYNARKRAERAAA